MIDLKNVVSVAAMVCTLVSAPANAQSSTEFELVGKVLGTQFSGTSINEYYTDTSLRSPQLHKHHLIDWSISFPDIEEIQSEDEVVEFSLEVGGAEAFNIQPVQFDYATSNDRLVVGARRVTEIIAFHQRYDLRSSETWNEFNDEYATVFDTPLISVFMCVGGDVVADGCRELDITRGDDTAYEHATYSAFSNGYIFHIGSWQELERGRDGSQMSANALAQHFARSYDDARVIPGRGGEPAIVDGGHQVATFEVRREPGAGVSIEAHVLKSDAVDQDEIWQALIDHYQPILDNWSTEIVERAEEEQRRHSSS